MPSTSAAKADPDLATQVAEVAAQPDITEAKQNHIDDNHDENSDLATNTMATEKDHERDDPATTAAREELKHTSISDKNLPESARQPEGTATDASDQDKPMEGTEKVIAPGTKLTPAKQEDLRERLSSPKKKRGRDQDNDTEYSDDSKNEEGSADGATADGGREKKRHRDTSEGPTKDTDPVLEAKEMPIMDAPDSNKTITTSDEPSTTKPTFGSSFTDKPQTSASAFASSGFGALAAASTSPFGTVGASKPSVFGGGNAQSTTSGFGSLSGSKSPPAAGTFGGVSAASTTSGFGGGFGGALGQKSVFGSALSNGFGGGTGPKLSSFAAAGKENEALPSKPVKAFGAPDSDEEDGEDSEDGSDVEGGEDEEGEKTTSEDKKKSKTTKVHIDDGEAGEATFLQLRAKLYTLESKEAGWKERGVGTVKINVNKSCVDTSDNGQAIPETLDFSSIDDSENVPAARLIMRQESTHRVILNTIIVRAMEFKEKPSSATAVQILFTAFEGDSEPRPVNMLLKLSEANSRSFMRDIKIIQYNLKDLP
ncbi:hypothetical protein PVAG01_01885 [Phlyctema vagabunda]|uniref:RanBD1 domain-containing protein n=1 Tax=Phlyctema vagabunda TaxID=108571 RepID=A0ABR4PZE5_9HELO